MRISLDLRTVGATMHGIARFGVELSRELFGLLDDVEWVLIGERNSPLAMLPAPPRGRREIVEAPPYSLREQVILPRLLARRNVDLHLATSYTAPVLSRVPFIFTIHDLIHLRMSHDYSSAHRAYYRFVGRPAARKAHAIFTVSEASKRDIVTYLSGDADRIVVLGNACSARFSPGDRDAARRIVRDRSGLDGPTLLWVGNEKPHKNLADALRIAHALKDLSPTPVLLAAGASEAFIRRQEQALGLPPTATATGPLDDDGLIAHYRACDAFLMTSLCEGFGLPLLEAMACAAPVVAYDTSSIPELLPDRDVLTAPGDATAAARVVRRILTDDAFARSRRRRGPELARRFNWGDLAQKAAGVIRRFEKTGKE